MLINQTLIFHTNNHNNDNTNIHTQFFLVSVRSFAEKRNRELLNKIVQLFMDEFQSSPTLTSRARPLVSMGSSRLASAHSTEATEKGVSAWMTDRDISTCRAQQGQ